ncbi:GNAT family N-acetyltransferase [Microvirga antarctica]|uniref:GNAT family N-acetyltransferase n=1 Tax=Microvirga antarctica TaxID=2819233 RepID=UPI001B311CD7|nr:GNAT family N-acetyltransferase [Microvirga antarctica]
MPPQIVLNEVCAADGPALVTANLASMTLHEPWVYPCRDAASFEAYLTRCDGERSVGFVARDGMHGRIVGVVNLNEIVRGYFQSAYLGYYAMADATGGGRMSEAVRMAVTIAFGRLGLHRLEANIQPGNMRSLALVQRLGFRREGYSPHYLNIGGAWRDHERWAILSEMWSEH